MKKLWNLTSAEVEQRVQDVEANGRWGRCALCHDAGGPALCPEAKRYDHLLSPAALFRVLTEHGNEQDRLGNDLGAAVSLIMADRVRIWIATHASP